MSTGGNWPKLYAGASDNKFRHPLSRTVDNSNTHSLENQEAFIGKENRKMRYIGSRKVTILIDYYEDSRGDTWYLSNTKEGNNV